MNYVCGEVENNEFKNNICLDCIKGIRPKKANNTKLHTFTLNKEKLKLKEMR